MWWVHVAVVSMDNGLILSLFVKENHYHANVVVAKYICYCPGLQLSVYLDSENMVENGHTNEWWIESKILCLESTFDITFCNLLPLLSRWVNWGIERALDYTSSCNNTVERAGACSWSQGSVALGCSPVGSPLVRTPLLTGQAPLTSALGTGGATDSTSLLTARC